MPADEDSGLDVYDDEQPSTRLTWDLPEIAAVAILVAFYLLALGGLVGGVLTAQGLEQEGFPNGGLTGQAIQSGSAWADPLLAMALLAVIALCWWQFRTWTEVDVDDIESVSLVFGHLKRARKLTLWTRVALILVAAGAIAFFVGDILIDAGVSGSSKEEWARLVVGGAGSLAALVIAGAGLIGCNRAIDQYAPRAEN